MIYPALRATDSLVGTQCYLCHEHFQVADIAIPVPAGRQDHHSIVFSVSANAHWRCTEEGKAVLAGTAAVALASNQRVECIFGEARSIVNEIDSLMRDGWEVTAMTTLSPAAGINGTSEILVTFRRAP
jgi:hypothetical protein